MKKQGISQEGLKLLACLTMLVDHIGAVLVPGNLILRCIGRLSFPIYCFLIAEGAHYTRNPKKYALRMALIAVLTELPYDLAFYGRYYPDHQNVMPTLLLGFCALEAMKRCSGPGWKLLTVLPFAAASELMQGDYGAEGVLIIALFFLTRELPDRLILQTLGLAAVFGGMASIPLFYVGTWPFQMQLLGVLAMVPIGLYSGRKAVSSQAVQWGFYLFYPVHLTILALIRLL